MLLDMLESLSEENFSALRAMNNIVTDMRIYRIESLIKNYLRLEYTVSCTSQVMQDCVFYFINLLFIMKGSSDFKHFLRKKIAFDIVTLDLQHNTCETDQQK